MNRTTLLQGGLLLLAACMPDADASNRKPASRGGTQEEPAETAAAQAVAEPEPVALVAATPEPPPPPPEPEYLELRKSKTKKNILFEPKAGAKVRGLTSEGGSFRVLAKQPGPGCADDWGQLEANGWLCLTGTEVAEEKPVPLPAMVTFDPPEPTEFDHYMETGEYDHGQPDQLTPAVYAKRWRRFKGQLYGSIEDYVAGKPAVGALTGGAGMKYRFEEIVETEKGPVLTRDDGKVARLDDVYLYPITRWQGRVFENDPPPAGLWPAITVNYDGAMVHPTPDLASEPLVTHPWHTPLWVEKTPASEDGHWWKVPDAGGPGIPGYIHDQEDVRHPSATPGRPDGVADDEVWVDVELNQQTLQLFRGDELIYWTVIASGAPPKGTPRGTYRILGKYAYKDMASRPGADDVYYVEDVPWTMVFRPAYALHAAYWHWGFGRVASHGCVNLAVKDARYLFENLGIGLPQGWEAIYPTAEESAVIRVRRGDDVGYDRREEFSSL